MTGITRRAAAEAVAALFGTTPNYSGGYSAWKVRDREGKDWSLVFDSSIHAKKKVGREYVSTIDGEYKVEMVSPKLEYSEMEKLPFAKQFTPQCGVKGTKRYQTLAFDMEANADKFQDVVRALRHAGAVVGEQCGQHVHIDAANSACRHSPPSLKRPHVAL